MDYDFEAAPLDQLDLTLVFWEEVLASGSSVEEEIRFQVWSFIYTDILDKKGNNLSEEEDEELQEKLDQFLETPKMKQFLADQAVKIHEFLKK